MLWHDWPDNVRGLEKLIEAASAWPGPDPLRLADLDELSINPSIVEALRGAYAAYVSAANAGRLGLREEQLAILISEIGATMFEQIFARSGQAIKGPVASWRDLVGKGMGNLRARLPTLGYDPATLAAATNCAQLLEACGLDKVTVRRTLSQAFAGLGSRDVPLSCGREQPRYAALESFFGLTHNKLRYSPRGRRGRAQGRNKANL